MSEIARAPIIARVGIDLAKQVIQVHAVDASGRRVVTRTFKRNQFFAWCAQLPVGCLVAMEACSSAHHWARKLRALGLDARLIAANFVTPYRMEGKNGKNDATDAAAICEAASRPCMRFVPVKTCEQQGVMSLHRVREGLKEERTACINQIRGVLTEFGLVFGKSPKVLRAVLTDVIEDASNELSTTARLVLQRAFDHWRELDEHLRWCDQQVGQHVRGSPAAKRAAKVIGIGELGASALAATSSVLGWAWCHAKTPAAARPVWDASPNAANGDDDSVDVVRHGTSDGIGLIRPLPPATVSLRSWPEITRREVSSRQRSFRFSATGPAT
jgi:transposase